MLSVKPQHGEARFHTHTKLGKLNHHIPIIIIMDLQSIDYEFEDEDEQNGEVTCPVCGEPWVCIENGDGWVVDEPVDSREKDTGEL